MDFAEMLTFLQQYTQCLSEYLSLTDKKIQAITKNDNKALDCILTSEQPFLMKIKSFESKRLDGFKQMGVGDASLEQFVSSVPEQYKDKTLNICTEIKDTIFKIKVNHTAIQDILELKLYLINKLLGDMPDAPKSKMFKV